MIYFHKTKRIYKIIEYFGERKSRRIIKSLEKSHKKELEQINKGTISTIESFRRQHDYQIKTIEESHNRALQDLQVETDKRIKAVEKEAQKSKDEMARTVDTLSKEMNKLSASEKIYEQAFSDIILDLRQMLPQTMAAVQLISRSEKNIEEIYKNTQKEINTLKKSQTIEDLAHKNHLRIK